MNIDWYFSSEVSEKLDTSPQVLMKTTNQRQSQYGKTRLNIKKRTLFYGWSFINCLIL
jgi:hypothetical protein